LDKYLANTNRDLEAALTRANFISAFSEAQFIAGTIDISSYTNTVESSYSTLNLSTHARGLCDLAESMLSYNLNISSHPEGNSPSYLSHRWKALSLALKSFTEASKLDDSSSSMILNLPKIHIKRGDCEVLRFQLGPAGYAPAVANAAVLLKNAGKFYSGAAANARNMGLEDEANEALFRDALARWLQGDGSDLKGMMDGDMSAESGVGRLVQEVLQDGLVSEDQLAALRF